MAQAPPPPPPPPPPPSDAIDNLLTGSVGDGPVVDARVRVYEDQGGLVADFRSDSTATYARTVRVEGKRYPLLITSNGGTDLVTGGPPDFELVTAAMRPARQTIGNINPHSTMIVWTALRIMPGPTDNALASARTTVLERLNFGFDSRLIGDPLTSLVDEDNVAVMVKSSEALGEMIRRTRDALIGTGVANADAVVDALAADLVDGLIDGRGAIEANTRIAAVSHLTSAQVLLESLENELRVNGLSATAAMDDAIGRIMPAATALTESVRIPAAMLSQAVVAVDAAVAFTGDPTLESTAAALRELPADALPADLRGRLPAGAGAALQAAIDEAASADAAGLDVIIDAVRTADDSRPGVARFSFDAASASVAEGDMLRLTIRRDSVAGEASVEWRTRAETARGGEDFRGQPGKRVTFADGESSRTIAVETLTDDTVEDEETFVVELSAPAGAELGTPTVVEITLFDAGAPAEYFAPELLSARAEGDSYVLSWSHPQHPPEGGYDVVVDGRGTGSDWRTTSLSATVGPLDPGSRHCFMIEARYPSDQEFRRSNELCVDPGAPPPPGTGTATLSWTPPTERVDGSALDNLAGYEIYYGQDPTRLEQVISLDNPGLTTYVVEELSQGTWHFGMKAVDAEGRHSALSNLGSKTFP